MDLAQYHAQAFDGKELKTKDRYWRCRMTFGFTGTTPEVQPEDVAQIKGSIFRRR